MPCVIASRGDVAVREMSQKFDGHSPEAFRLSEREIESALSRVDKRDLEDIRFAQMQVRNFAQKQREALRDIEVETRHGSAQRRRFQDAAGDRDRHPRTEADHAEGRTPPRLAG